MNDNKSILSVQEYIDSVPVNARPTFDDLLSLVASVLPVANQVVSYGIIGFKTDETRAKVFVSGWKDHVAIYPVPNDDLLASEMNVYRKGKGTLSFPLDQPLPTDLIARTVKALIK